MLRAASEVPALGSSDARVLEPRPSLVAVQSGESTQVTV